MFGFPLSVNIIEFGELKLQLQNYINAVKRILWIKLRRENIVLLYKNI